MSTSTGRAGARSRWSGRAVKAALALVLLLAFSTLRPTATFAVVTATTLTTGTNTNSQTTYTTASITPSPNTLILAFIDNNRPDNLATPVLSGNGLTWVPIRSVDWRGQVNSVDDRLTVFRAMGASPTSGSVTITYSITQNNCLWTIMQFEGIDTSGTNGSSAVLQSVVNSSFDSDVTAMTLTLATLENSNNASVGFFGIESVVATAITPASGYSASPLVVGSGPNRSERVVWKAPGTGTVDVTFGEKKKAAGIALEIKAVTVILRDGADPGSVPLPPGGAATFADSFTLQTVEGVSTLTGMPVALSAGSSAALSLVEITNEGGTTVYGSVSNPGSDAFTIPLSTSITATLTETPYKIRITPRSHLDMPAPPGAVHAVTAKINNTGSFIGSDTGGATITIDNRSPGEVGSASAAPGDAEATVSWTSPGDADLGSVVVLRSTSSPIIDKPVEGQAYSAGDGVGASKVACVASSPATSCTAGSLINTTTYHFKVFTRDTNGNYSASGVATPTPATPQHYQPDAMIKLPAEAEYLTDNSYEAASNTQVRSQGVTTGSTAVYNLRFQNDGTTTDDIVITGTGNGSNFTVQYLDGSTDRTAAVTGAGYTIAGLGVGALRDWTVTVTPNGGATPVSGGTSYPVFVTAASGAAGAKVDQVKAVTASTSANITLLKSADKSAYKPGEEILYTINASNGPSLTDAKSVVVTDPIPLNTGFKVGGASFAAGSSTLTSSITYSNGSWGYTPVSGGCGAPAGYDYCVTQVKWSMTGIMPTASSFTVYLVVRVK